MKKVKSLQYNWHQASSTIDRDGAGQNWDWFEVGVNGVQSIIEHEPIDGFGLWNYEVELENGTSYRIFNPNFVEYKWEH